MLVHRRFSKDHVQLQIVIIQNFQSSILINKIWTQGYMLFVNYFYRRHIFIGIFLRNSQSFIIILTIIMKACRQGNVFLRSVLNILHFKKKIFLKTVASRIIKICIIKPVTSRVGKNVICWETKILMMYCINFHKKLWICNWVVKCHPVLVTWES